MFAFQFTQDYTVREDCYVVVVPITAITIFHHTWTARMGVFPFGFVCVEGDTLEGEFRVGDTR